MIFQTKESKSFQERQSLPPGTWLGVERRMPGHTVTVGEIYQNILKYHFVKLYNFATRNLSLQPRNDIRTIFNCH